MVALLAGYPIDLLNKDKNRLLWRSQAAIHKRRSSGLPYSVVVIIPYLPEKSIPGQLYASLFFFCIHQNISRLAIEVGA